MRRALPLMLCWLTLAALALAQDDPGPPPTDTRPPQGLQMPDLPRLAPNRARVDVLEQRRRLQEVDRLLAVGNLSRAESLIKELSGQSMLARELLPRRIRLAALKGDPAEAAALCREALAAQPRNANLWRELLLALLDQDLTAEARAAADSFLVHAPDRRAASAIITEGLGATERPRITVAFIDSMRLELGDPRLLARQRALGLLTAGRQDEAAAELSAELRGNPFNLALIRTELLDGPYRPGRQEVFVAGVATRAAEPRAVPAEGVLAVNLMLADGDATAALAEVRPLLAAPPGQRAVLQNAAALGRESGLVGDERQAQAATDYLLVVLGELAGPGNRDLGLRRRAVEILGGVGLAALDGGWLAADPHEAARRLDGILETIRAVDPASGDLYAGQIRLAAYTRDELGDPAGAATRLEAMLLNLDLPLEGVALVRLTLGECYLAATDTARARAVLTSLGRDPAFREAGGHAHYHLARLDLAEGSFVTARDRFAVVAMDNPAADYANDALDLGLAVAEELDNPSGGPAQLTLYARSVYWDLVGRSAERRAALRDFITQAAALANPDDPQRLLERGRWELAHLEIEAGNPTAALELLATITASHPDGRYPAAALAERARLLLEAGRMVEARTALDLLLAQYPDWLFVDDARDALRRLP